MGRSTTTVPRDAVPRERPGPPGGKRDRNRQAQVDALASAALACFLAKGIEATTIDDITRAAGTAKGSFYRYFAGKETLVEALLAPVGAGFEAAFAQCDLLLSEAGDRASMTAAYTHLGITMGTTIFQNGDRVRLYLQESRGPAVGARRPVTALADQIREGAFALTATAHAHGLLRPFPAEVSALSVIGAAERLVLATLNGRIAEPEQLPAQLTGLVLEGLAGTG